MCMSALGFRPQSHKMADDPFSARTPAEGEGAALGYEWGQGGIMGNVELCHPAHSSEALLMELGSFPVSPAGAGGGGGVEYVL